MDNIFGKLAEIGGELANASGNFLEAAVLNPIRELPLDQQYTALKDLSAQMGKDPEFFKQMDKMPTELQQSFTSAYLNNANFREYISDNNAPAVDGEQSLANSIFENLYKDGVTVGGEQVLDPQRVNAVQGILNSVASDPNYDPARIDNVVSVMEEGKALLTAANADGSVSPAEAEALKANQRAMYRALRDAGADIPAFANMDLDMFMDFVTTLMEDGFEAAIGGLITDLDIEGTPQAESLENLAGKVAPFAKFMAQPYYDLVQDHGDDVVAGAKDLMHDVQTVAGGNVEATGADAAQATASITQLYGGMDFGAMAERLGINMEALGKYNPFFNTSAVGENATREAEIANSPHAPAPVLNTGTFGPQ